MSSVPNAHAQFELAVNLLRLLECITLELPEEFVETDDDVNISRLAELTIHVLNHHTTGTDAILFNTVTTKLGVLRALCALRELRPPPFMLALEKIQRGDILSPVVGVLLNMFRRSPKGIIEALLLQPAFRMESFSFLEGFCREGDHIV